MPQPGRKVETQCSGRVHDQFQGREILASCADQVRIMLGMHHMGQTVARKTLLEKTLCSLARNRIYF
jgi:hypothetical protein